MYTNYTKKWLIGGLALSLALSVYFSYGGGQVAFAAGSGKTQQQPGGKQQSGSRATQKRIAIVEEAASIIGVKPDDLRESLKQGKSIADVAASHGVKEETLVDKLVAMREKTIGEAVRSGKLEEDKAERIKARMKEHIAYMVAHKGLPEHAQKYAEIKRHSQGLVPPNRLAAILGISEEQLTKQLDAGQSLAEIAQSRGMTKEQLVGKLKEELTPLLEKAVDRKRSPKQEDKPTNE